jgi:hypothetical protein
MDFCPSKLKLPLIIAATVVAVLSAVAEDSAPQPGQSILFSTPQNNDSSASALPGPDNSTQPNVRDVPAPPQVIFNFSGPETPPPPRQKPASAADRLRLQKARDDRDNWMLMTPGEILGVSAQEKILQTPEQRAAEDKMTAMERYFARQKQTQLEPGVTNNWQNWNSSAAWNFSHNREDRNPYGAEREKPGNSKSLLDRIMNNTPLSREPEDRSPAYGWDSFSASTTLPPPQKSVKPATDFNNMLEPVSAQPRNPVKISTGNNFFPAPSPDPYLEPQPVVNRNGASFTPLTSGIGRPARLTPLPGLIPQPIAPPITHSWWQQPPTWLATGPQPFTVPQRKF